MKITLLILVCAERRIWFQGLARLTFPNFEPFTDTVGAEEIPLGKILEDKGAF
jgi:hypothetical protein